MAELSTTIEHKTATSEKPFKVRMACVVVALILKILRWTYRFEVVGETHRVHAAKSHPSGAFAIAAWHENCFGCIMGHAKQDISLLVSPSFDGDLTAYAANSLGLKAVRGSSSRGGKAAVEAYLDLAPMGTSIAITVDGPKGPRHGVKPGIVSISAKAGLQILPTTSYAPRSFVLHKSWDKMRIPKPFSKVYIGYGEPISVPETVSKDEFNDLSEQVAVALHKLDRKMRGASI